MTTGNTVSTLSQRCERIRDSITLEQLFTQRGWDYTPGHRILCLWPDHDDHKPDMQIYPDTNSVHCFVCAKSGDVIELTRYCIPERGVWSVEQAATWLERTFELPELTAPESLRRRLRRSLVTPTAPSTGDAQRRTATSMVHAAFDAVERDVPASIILAVANQRESIWAAADVPGTDPLDWAASARTMIYGSYANRVAALREIEVDLATSAPDVLTLLWDDTRNVDEALRWETHRGVELPSPWPVCVTGM